MAYILSGPPTGQWILTYTEEIYPPLRPETRTEITEIYWQPDLEACELLLLRLLEEPWAAFVEFSDVYAIGPDGARYPLE